MLTFNFKTTCTNSLIIAIQAETRELAWEQFDIKHSILESMGVTIPRRTTWQAWEMRS